MLKRPAHDSWIIHLSIGAAIVQLDNWAIGPNSRIESIGWIELALSCFMSPTASSSGYQSSQLMRFINDGIIYLMTSSSSSSGNVIVWCELVCDQFEALFFSLSFGFELWLYWLCNRVEWKNFFF